jgi:mannosyltransferase OCH1-like enzyme
MENKEFSSLEKLIQKFRNISEENFTNEKFLENFIINEIGLNNENLKEQPPELFESFGKNLKVWQYPNQFSKFLIWLYKNAKECSSYYEIGSRWGGTFIIICETLLKSNPNFKSFIALDIINEPENILEYKKINTKVKYIKNYSQKEKINSDIVFIDGDHSYFPLLLDYTNNINSKIIVFHDIISDACTDTISFWNQTKYTRDFIEFIDQYDSVKGNFLGIGVLYGNKKDLLSIILPVYNPPIDLLEKCIVSIVNNKWQNFEVIITVDYYSDLIINILKKISEEDKRFKLFINKDNAGSYHNYFHTIKNVSENSKYITILDCDDAIEENYYYDLITQLKEENAELIWNNQKYFNYITKEISEEKDSEESIRINGSPRLVKSVYTKELVERLWDNLTKLNTFVFYGTDFIIGKALITESKKTIWPKTNSAYIYTTFNINQSVNAMKKDYFSLVIRLLTTVKSLRFFNGLEGVYNDIEYIKNCYKLNTTLSQKEKDMLTNFVNKRKDSLYFNNSIPPIIHWCWISDFTPKEVEENILNWSIKNPDYLIVKWDDKFFKNNPFVQSAIKTKKYATASDYIRLWALYNFGGIYLDSDCECIKSFNEELLQRDLLLGYEEGNYIAGHFIGASLVNPLIKKVLDWYDDKIFDESWMVQGPSPIQKGMPYTLPGLFTNLLKDEKLTIYPKDYFTAKNYATKETYITENTYILHHYAASWLKEDVKVFDISDFGFK